MSLFGTPIQWAKIRRHTSNASWIADRAALHKMVQLCSACECKMPRYWLRTHHYAELTAAHGVGTCDGCRHEDTLTMFISQDDPWYLELERHTRARAALDAADADQGYTVHDRRMRALAPG